MPGELEFGEAVISFLGGVLGISANFYGKGMGAFQECKYGGHFLVFFSFATQYLEAGDSELRAGFIPCEWVNGKLLRGL